MKEQVGFRCRLFLGETSSFSPDPLGAAALEQCMVRIPGGAFLLPSGMAHPQSGACSVPGQSGVAFLHGQHPDRDTLLGETLLPLLPQHGESTHLDEAVQDVQVSDHAAVQAVQGAALPGHIVLQDDHTVVLQAVLAANQKLQEIFVCQVSYRRKDGKDHCQPFRHVGMVP